ncbi:hypothetical protein OHQ88_10655 [Micromonospora zamorensis]|uniref:hypothetical protein n=1 Tax=Micromonospora zamorensis TaxID=709883 RepID=UPI002E1BE3AC
MTPYEWMSGLLDVIGSGVANSNTESGRRLRQCPAHLDRTPSMSVRPGVGGRVHLHCFVCDGQAILTALRCSWDRLTVAPRISPAEYAAMVGLRINFPPVVASTSAGDMRGWKLEAVHDYGDARLFRHRAPGGQKRLSWESRTPGGGWVPGFFGGVTTTSLPLYRQAEVQMAVAAGEPVLLVESESSVDALRGWYATTWAGGAAAVNIGRIAQVLGGYPNTIVIPDNDPAGLACLARLHAAGLAPHVLMPGADEDARDLHSRLGPAGFDHAIRHLVRAVA